MSTLLFIQNFKYFNLFFDQNFNNFKFTFLSNFEYFIIVKYISNRLVFTGISLNYSTLFIILFY